MTGAAPTEDPAALKVEGLTKAFEGQLALSDVSLEVAPGEVHALLGQNGCGKSTLIKVLAGYHRPEDGAKASLYGEEMALDGIPPPAEAPIRFIHQDLGLVGSLGAVDNLALTSGYQGQWYLGNRRESRVATAFLSKYGIDIDVNAPVESLSMATQAMLAILRAIKDVPAERLVLVVDEATASLPSEEVELVFRLLREIKSRGGSVLYVTHRLTEIFEIADRVTVLRDGLNVATEKVEGLDHDRLVNLIIGRSVEAFYATKRTKTAETVLEVRNLSGDVCRDVSLEVHRGDIVGVTGLVGSGYETLLSLIFGGITRAAGEVLIDGVPVPNADPSTSIAAGLAFAPADRRSLSAIPEWSLARNVTLPKVEGGRGLLPWLSDRRECGEVEPWLEQLGIEPRDPSLPLSSLSGGNQQRVVIARWLRCGFKVMMLEDPTIGVDVGAKPAIHGALAEAARQGAGVLMTTSDVEEAAAVCNRIVVLVDGRVGAVLEESERSVERILTTAMAATSSDFIGAEN